MAKKKRSRKKKKSAEDKAEERKSIAYARVSAGKERLDKLLVTQGICETRQQAKGYILAGQVLVDDTCIDKVGAIVDMGADIRLRGKLSPYVSRGGGKLEAALNHFEISVEDRIAVDFGASTGGFCDCLLQRGCTKVVALDVGYGQLHEKMRKDPRVLSLEKTNARYVQREDLPLDPDESIEVITSDMSFISLRVVLPAMAPLLAPNGDMVLLVKPQFEVGKEFLQKGIVRDEAARQESADRVSEVAKSLGLVERGRIDSPVHGPKGNIEILLWLQREANSTSTPSPKTSESPSDEE